MWLLVSTAISSGGATSISVLLCWNIWISLQINSTDKPLNTYPSS